MWGILQLSSSSSYPPFLFPFLPSPIFPSFRLAFPLFQLFRNTLSSSSFFLISLLFLLISSIHISLSQFLLLPLLVFNFSSLSSFLFPFHFSHLLTPSSSFPPFNRSRTGWPSTKQRLNSKQTLWWTTSLAEALIFTCWASARWPRRWDYPHLRSLPITPTAQPTTSVYQLARWVSDQVKRWGTRDWELVVYGLLGRLVTILVEKIMVWSGKAWLGTGFVDWLVD